MSKGFRDGTHYMVDSRAIEAVIKVMRKFTSSINMSRANKATITKIVEHLINSPTISYQGFENKINAVDTTPIPGFEAVDDQLKDMLDSLGMKLPDNPEDE